MAGNSGAVAEMKEMAALMRDSGLTVSASSGWESRGVSSNVNYWAILDHHTAATGDIDNMLINGRSDLPGPLCNWALHEYGEWVMIASGRANHAGEGTLPSSESYGIEATGPQGYPDTYGPAAFPHNYDSYLIGVSCMLAVMNGDVSDIFGHKETARPLGRKIDPYFDMGGFRKSVDSGVPVEDELSAESVEEGTLAALKKFYADGIIYGQNTFADTYRVMVDRQDKMLAELREIKELLSPPPPPV